MSTSVIALPALHLNANKPNDNLWNNNGTQFLHYTVTAYPTSFTKERIRSSLAVRAFPNLLRTSASWLERTDRLLRTHRSLRLRLPNAFSPFTSGATHWSDLSIASSFLKIDLSFIAF